MKSILYIVILTTLFGVSLVAQKNEGIIIYDEEQSMASQLSEEQKALAAFLPSSIHLKLTVHFNKHQALTKSEIANNGMFSKVEQNDIKFLMDSKKEIQWVIKKDEYSHYAEAKKLNFSEIKLTGKKKKILGYTCKEAKLKGKDATLWYSPTLPNTAAPNMVRIKEGGILAYEDKSNTIVAASLDLKKLDASIFDLPKGCTVLDKKAAQKSTNNELGEAKAINLGDKFPNFELMDLAGNIWKLDELRNKVVVFNFWFAACKPCLAEIPELNKLVEQYQDKNIIFLAVSTDNWAKAQHMNTQLDFDYEIIPNAQKWVDGLSIKAYPTHIVIDDAGKVVLYEKGAAIYQLKRTLDNLFTEDK